MRQLLVTADTHDRTGHISKLSRALATMNARCGSFDISHNLLLLLLVVASVASFFYWRLSFYYYFFDELVMLDAMKGRGIQSFFEAQNEHFAPFFKALFYGYTKAFGNAALQWHWLVLLSHMLTILLVALLTYSLTRRRDLSFLLALLCGFCPLIWETTIRQAGLGTTSSVAAWLFSLWCIFESPRAGSKKLLWIGVAAAWLQSYTFGNALFYPALLIPVIFYTQPAGSRLKPALALVAIQAVNVLVFFWFGSFQNNKNYQDPLSIETAFRIAQYFFFFSYANLGRLLITSEVAGPVEWSVVRWDVAGPFTLLLLASCFVMFKDRQTRIAIILGWLSYALLVGLISVSRYKFPLGQALSSRYIYLMFPSVVLILAPVLAFFSKYCRALSLLLLCGIVLRFAVTYDIVSRERHQAEKLYATNYQLIVLAKTDPALEIADFLATGPLGTVGSVQLLNWLEDRALFRINHRVPRHLRVKKQDLLLKMKRHAP